MTGYVALGSNLGDRLARIEGALALLPSAGIDVGAVSSVWETEPVAADGPQWFLNAAARVETALPPEGVLSALLEIERAFGRTRVTRNAPRSLDLDLLLLGSLLRDSPWLRLPHPRMEERRFVLAPLAEVAPELVLPRSGRTVAAALAALPPVPRALRVGILAMPGARPVYSPPL